MKPTDANPRDYSLYYNGTWMQHTEKGPVYVMAENGRLNVKTQRGAYALADPNLVMPLWLRPGAVNIGKSDAVYIGRRARRSAKRSMSPEHYMLKWSHDNRSRVCSGKHIWAALSPKYTPFADAVKLLNSGEARARAVARDMILYMSRGQIAVLLRGSIAGYIDKGLFVPVNEIGPLAKMARGRLIMEGIAC